jgi:proteasome lid subunit RPN8/RPN11
MKENPMLKLNHAALHKIKVHALQSYPDACSGFLLGTVVKGEKCACDVVERKVRPDLGPSRSFSRLSEEEVKAATEFARRGQVELIGIYHSHASSFFRPSEADLDIATPAWSYLVVTVEDSQPTLVTSWVLKSDRSSFEEESIQFWVDHDSYSTNHPVKA